MIPVEKYATVHQDATLLEAILTLERSQPSAQEHLQPYRAVLITDDNHDIVGKIGHLGFFGGPACRWSHFAQRDPVPGDHTGAIHLPGQIEDDR